MAFSETNNWCPLVTVIIPCYNQSQYLPHALDSVFAQTYTNWECIIVNDGSSDDTERIAQDWCKKDKRFRYIKQKNSGLSSARNLGLKQANGDYIQLLDSDDLLQVNKIRDSVELICSSSSSVDIIYSFALFFSATTDELRYNRYSNQEWMPKISGNGLKVINFLLEKNIMVVSSPMISKTLVDRVGYFNVSLTSYEDWDYWIRAAMKDGYFKFLPNNGNNATLVRVSNNSMMSNTVQMILNENIIRIKYNELNFTRIKAVIISLLRLRSFNSLHKTIAYLIG